MIIRFLSYGNIGGTIGTDPLANIILSAFIISISPSSFVTSIVFLSISLPNPFTKFIPLLSNKNSIPLINWSTILSFLDITALKSALTFPSIFIPKFFASFIFINIEEDASNALVGIQPTFKQVPPTFFFSITVTSPPSIAAFIAATYPPGPPPITAIFISIPPYHN